MQLFKGRIQRREKSALEKHWGKPVSQVSHNKKSVSHNAETAGYGNSRRIRSLKNDFGACLPFPICSLFGSSSSSSLLDAGTGHNYHGPHRIVFKNPSPFACLLSSKRIEACCSLEPLQCSLNTCKTLSFLLCPFQMRPLLLKGHQGPVTKILYNRSGLDQHFCMKHVLMRFYSLDVQRR